jgi:diguanylate cyclase (GGDEF)-like protein
MTYPATFELPTTDQLTGLVTSHYFRHLMRDQLVPQARESGDPLTVVLVDLDNFLGINETHGHACGDRVLAQVAATLKETLPETAVVSRYGGDEFAAALPDTRVDDTFMLVEELRRRVSALRFEECPEVQLTCSIGLAAYPGNGSNDVELIRSADQALYDAKVNGRNRVSLPSADSRMTTKTSYYTTTQLERLSQLAKKLKRNEASILREALDDALKKYNDRLEAENRRQ